MIGVRCDRCGAHFWAKDEAAGRSATCARCGQILRIPDPPDEDDGEPRPVAPTAREIRPGSPPPFADEPGPAGAWLPRELQGRDGTEPDLLRSLLITTRQIRFLLAVLIAIGLILVGLLVLLSARVFHVRVVS
jgi:DNA-directed RNA polymerase subunit RPC12/RpoP